MAKLSYSYRTVSRVYFFKVYETKGLSAGGGGGSRTRVRKCHWSRAYMRSRVPALGITPRTFAAPAQNGQETGSASLQISSSLPRRSREDQLAVRRSFTAHEQSRGERLPN